jgi:hypothetical protein
LLPPSRHSVILLPGVVIMLGSRLTATLGLLTVLSVCLSACSSSSTGVQPEPSTAPTAEPTTGPTTEPTTEPKPEPTGPESPQPTRKKPSYSAASVPTGSGAGGESGRERCVELVWGTALPEGVTVVLGTPRLHAHDGHPATDVFRIDNSICTRKGKRPKCAGFRLDKGACYVGVRQVTTERGKTVTLALPATVTCPTWEVCNKLKKENEKGGGFDLTSDGRGETTEQPPGSPSETPTETSTESPAEATPADSPAETASADG